MMTALLYFDSETSDFHEDSNPADPVQLACVLSHAASGRTISTMSCLIRRDGWPTRRRPIAQRVIDIHGITDALCNTYGEPPQLVLDQFRRMLACATHVIGHNVSFDLSVMTFAATAMEMPPFNWPPAICTMKESAPIVKLPAMGKYNIGGYKAPKLVEAYHYFTGKEITNAHDALADVYATRAVHRGIIAHINKE